MGAKLPFPWPPSFFVTRNRNKQGDAFLLFVERMQPHLFANKEDTDQPCQNGQAGPRNVSRQAVAVRRYRDEAESWARARRNVSTQVLEDLHLLWNRGEGFSPAEYGALMFSHLEVRYRVNLHC